MTVIDFTSDNVAGVAPTILRAMIEANDGSAAAYGADDWTARAVTALSGVFETDLAAFPIGNGTAANALALAHVTRPWSTIVAHADAHIAVAESNAVELLGGGAKVVGLAGANGKLTAEALALYLDATRIGAPGRPRPAVLSLTQATEAGTLYTPGEITELSTLAHAAGMLVHVDGARFAAAIAATGATPAEMTWRAGVDLLSLGSSKVGTMNAEAVIFFDPARAADFDLRMRQAGHSVAKARYLSVQLVAWLDCNLWLEFAAHANRMAVTLADALIARGARPTRAPAANMVFAELPTALQDALARRGIKFARHPGVARFVTSWATGEDHMAAVLSA